MIMFVGVSISFVFDAFCVVQNWSTGLGAALGYIIGAHAGTC